MGILEFRLLLIGIQILLKWLSVKDEAEQKQAIDELNKEVTEKVKALPPTSTKKDLVEALTDGLFSWLVK